MFKPGFYYDEEYEMIRLIECLEKPGQFTGPYTDWTTGVVIPKLQIDLRMVPVEVYNTDGSIHELV